MIYNKDMKKQQKNFLQEGMKLISKCPVCKTKKKTEAHVMEGSDSRYILHVTCHVCGHAVLTVMEKSEVGVSCIGIVTDLKKTEATKILDGKSIVVDDIIDLHIELSDKEFLKRLV